MGQTGLLDRTLRDLLGAGGYNIERRALLLSSLAIHDPRAHLDDEPIRARWRRVV